MKLCEVCEKIEAEYSYQVEERKVLVCEKCLREAAGNAEWGDWICKLTGKIFTSESIRIERKEEGNAGDSKPEPKHSNN